MTMYDIYSPQKLVVFFSLSSICFDFLQKIISRLQTIYNYLKWISQYQQDYMYTLYNLELTFKPFFHFFTVSELVTKNYNFTIRILLNFTYFWSKYVAYL